MKILKHFTKVQVICWVRTTHANDEAKADRILARMFSGLEYESALYAERYVVPIEIVEDAE